MDFADRVAIFIEGLFTHAHVMSMVLGYIVSMGITNWFKTPLRFYLDAKGQPFGLFAFWTNTFAAAVGFVVTFLTWPQKGVFAVCWALAIGFTTPWVYKGVIRLVSHFWPWLPEKVSADRVLPDSTGPQSGV